MTMLSIPKGFQRSVKAHNIKVETFLDWVETTSLIAQEELSPSDIIDYLIEEQFYDEQDFAAEFVLPNWDTLEARLSGLGHHSPVSFKQRWMVRQVDWTEVPAYSFCLVVSLGPQYVDWTDRFGSDYSVQGELFESVTKAAMEVQFSGWRFLHTGWRKDNTSRLGDVVGNLTSYINEPIGYIDEYASCHAHEAGLDLVWHLPFADRRGGAPVYLVQCASGKKWEDKVNEPNIKVWTKIIDFAGTPCKAFSLPYSLSKRELRRQTNRSRGLILDRYRLLAHNISEKEWVPAALCHDLTNWLEPRIDWIKSK